MPSFARLCRVFPPELLAPGTRWQYETKARAFGKRASLSGFDALVQQIGTRAAQYGRPVLLLEGDSHAFRVDQPFSPTSPLFGVHANTPAAPNVTRVVVEGSDAGRTEYLRLTVDPGSKTGQLFSMERVPLQ